MDGEKKVYAVADAVPEGSDLTAGKEYLAEFLTSAAVSASTWTCKYIAVGSVNTAEAADQTALGTELARHTGTVSYLTGAICQVTATFA